MVTPATKKSNNIEVPEAVELAKAGVHLGHKTTKRSPQMDPYIYGLKNTIHIIDLEKTREMLKKALDFIIEEVSQGGVVLFLGTKPSAREIIKKYAQKSGSPYVVNRWLGGTLTNFDVIMKQIGKFKKMNQEKEKGEWEKYTKKEALEKERELERLKKLFGGLILLEKRPDIVYIVDLQKEKTAVREAKRTKIPTVAMVDTNANPTLVTHPIPANDDAIKSIELITSLVARAVEEGREKIKDKK